MSRRFLDSFFPSTTALLEHFVPRLLEQFLPSNLDETCPEVVVAGVRNPILALTIVIGIFIGLQGAYVHYYKQHRETWARAFFAFACMNAAALPLHCLLSPRQDLTSAQEYPFLWMTDCVCTGLSSVHLVQGSLQWIMENSSLRGLGMKAETRRKLLSRVVLVGYLFILLAVLSSWLINISFVRFITGHDNRLMTLRENDVWKEPLWVEWSYLGPLNLALVVCPVAVLGPLWHDWPMDKMGPRNLSTLPISFIWPMLVMAAGQVLGALGVFRIAWFCQNLPQMWDVSSAPTLIFAGCNVCFVGLYIWLQCVMDAEPKVKQI